MSKPKTCILVSGMHRSGTSCLMGSLQNLGLYSGNNQKESIYNIKGNRELKSIRKFHDAVWKSNNHSWYNPLVIDQFSFSEAEYLKLLINKEFQKESVFGLKDPRLLFFLNAWISVFPNIDFKVLCSIRNPIDVATSLELRNDMNYNDALFLWMIYNKQILKLAESTDIHFVDFDSPEDHYNAQVRSLYSSLIEDSGNYDSVFYDRKLKNNNTKKLQDLPEDILNIYLSLKSKMKQSTLVKY